VSETIPHGVHLVGIGGMHMSAIARILLARGHAVSGSDLRRSPLTDAVEALGVRVAIGHAAANLGDADLVVTTSAATADNPELNEARRRAIPVIKRADMVARLMAGKIGVCIAGCHGKSTTSGMVAYILAAAGRDPTYLIGAEVAALGTNAAAGRGPHVVVEADEYDRAFLSYHPQVALVTNVEADHLDYYKTWEAVQEAFRQFVSQVSPVRTGWSPVPMLLLCADDAEALSLRAYAQPSVDVQTYALDTEADWRAVDVESDGPGYRFEVMLRGETFGRFRIALPIRHNVLNALGAVAACHAAGLSAAEIAAGLPGYTGVRRRFERRGEAAGVLVMDDYAHHPTEIAATAAAVRLHFPGRRSVALFQPHTYARSRYLLPAFRSCFRDFDRLFILETYAAREAIADGLTAAQLAAEIELPPPTCVAGFEAAADLVVAELRPGDVFFTVGAGDVDTVVPLVLERLRSRGGATAAAAEIRPSAIEGNGCFATTPIKEGDVVSVWQGTRVANAEIARIEADGKYHSSIAIGEDESLLFNVIDPGQADASLAEGSGTGGFNHSCAPNLWLEDEVTVVARRDIEPGEELTIDYALFSVSAEWRLSPCNCGAETCRRDITGEDWRLPELQRRYRGHFSPFINERIERQRS